MRLAALHDRWQPQRRPHARRRQFLDDVFMMDATSFSRCLSEPRMPGCRGGHSVFGQALELRFIADNGMKQVRITCNRTCRVVGSTALRDCGRRWTGGADLVGWLSPSATRTAQELVAALRCPSVARIHCFAAMRAGPRPSRDIDQRLLGECRAVKVCPTRLAILAF